MSLEGLRAWIGEVERKLGKRTRVFLVLSLIAIGLGGAATYLAIDARESSVSESDVQALQEKLETRIDELGGSATTPPVEAEPEVEPTPAPKPKEQKPQSESGKENKGASGSGTPGGATGTENIPKGATGGAASSAELQELLEQAKKRSEQVEKERAGK
jgi:hypothetical protein